MCYTEIKIIVPEAVMKLTTLIENTTCDPALTKEHGLSLFLETDFHKILFDFGQTDALFSNAELLGIDLSKADLAILSHGHYDHGGGLMTFLEKNRIAPVYINRHAFGDFYNGTEKYIGLDSGLKNGDRLCFVDDMLEIAPGLTLYSCNERISSDSDTGHGLTQKCGGEFTPDRFLHEHYLLIKEKGKKILISGCSHKGIADIVSWFSPDILVGGFHLKHLTAEGKDAETLTQLAQKLLAYPTRYYTGHCTGKEQFAFLKNLMGERLQAISTGMTVEL